VDFWVHTTLEGYIIEFSIENHQYFSKAEAIFYKGARGRLLREISLWIKILLAEEGMLSVPSVEMACKTLGHEGWVIQERVHELGYKSS
jgi:hypothetical protein